MSDDKMRAEFEKWAKAEGYSLRKYTQAEFEAFAKADGLDVLRWLDFSSSYIDSETTAAEHGYEAGYQAGRKAEQAEVERLRAELAAAKAEIESVIRLGPHPVEQVQMPLATFVETRFVPVWQYNELADKLERTRGELAAAKAASVVPVKWKSVERFFKSGADLGNQWGIEFWFDTKEQRDKFGKWMKERGEG